MQGFPGTRVCGLGNRVAMDVKTDEADCGSLIHGPVLPVSALHGTPQVFSVTHDGVSDWSNHFLYEWLCGTAKLRWCAAWMQ